MNRRHVSHRMLSFAGLCLMIICAVNAGATTFYVNQNGGSDSNGGTDWSTDAWLTIQHALDNVTSTGDVIQVSEGTYTENVVFSASGTNNLTLKGGYDDTTWAWAPASNVSTINGSGGDCITISSLDNTIIGFTLTGGDEGIEASIGNAYPDSLHTVTQCIISNNTGEGIYIHDARSSLMAVNCLVADNGGVGIWIHADSATTYPNQVYACTIVNNDGDGYTDSNNYHYPTTLKNCLIAGNGGYGIEHVSTRNSDTIYNCCVYSNALGNIYANPNGIAKTVLAGGNMAGYPAFAGVGNYHLTASSPCVDYGLDLTGDGVTDDLEGNARSAPYDIGCYEFGSGAATRYATTYVNATTGADANAGNTSGTAKRTIGGAAAITSPSGTCHVAASTYSESLFLDLAAITIAGADRDTTTLSGSLAYKVWITTDNCWISGFTIRDGSGGGLVGGVSANDTFGATDCTFSNNTHGVTSVASSSRVFIRRCLLTGNNNGVYLNLKAGLRAYNCQITGNTVDGIYMNADNSGRASYVYNCTISDNGDDGYEDVNNYHVATYFKNCIVTENGDYGIYHGSTRSGNQDYVNYCDLWGNATADTYAGNANVVIGAGVISADPSFVGGTDYSLTSSSPGIGAGTDLSGDGITNDLDGVARTNDYDLGCYESPYVPVSSYADTYVDASRPDDSGDGSSWATAKRSIGAALAVTDVGGTCHVTNGTYAEAISVPANTTIAGTDRDLTVLSGAGTIVTIANTNSVLRSLTVAGGSAGVSVTGDNNLLDNCVMQSNTSYGADITGDYVTLGQCVARANGTAVYTHGSPCQVTLDRTVLTNNTSYGVYAINRTAITARNCLIADNGLDGVYHYVDNGPASQYIYNCTIADNGRDGWHDSHHWNKTAYFKNCNVTGNGGYGIIHEGGAYSSYVSYCNVYGNATNTSGAELIIQDGVFGADPNYAGAPDYHLGSGSPCIDAGTDLSGDGVTIDLDGNARTNTYDTGCYESDLPPAEKYAATYVDAARPDDSGAGTNWVTAKQTIGAALTITETSGTCSVAAGTYAESVSIPGTMTLEGAGSDVATIDGAGTVVAMSQDNATLSGFTVTGGSTGVRVAGAGNRVEQCTVWSNSSYGVDILADNNTLEECTISGSAIGVYVHGSPITATFSSCAITGNTGNGIDVRSKSAVNALNCLVADNGGDGVYIQCDNPGRYNYLDYCTIVDNAGDGYQDAHQYHYSTWMTNCIVSGNGGYGYVRNGTVSRNNYLSHTCVHGNTLGEFSGAGIVLQSGMITNQLPMLKPDYGLKLRSPCKDTAADIGVTIDLAGMARPRVRGFDMGAYEAPPAGTTIQLK